MNVTDDFKHLSIMISATHCSVSYRNICFRQYQSIRHSLRKEYDITYTTIVASNGITFKYLFTVLIFQPCKLLNGFGDYVITIIFYRFGQCIRLYEAFSRRTRCRLSDNPFFQDNTPQPILRCLCVLL